MNVRTGLILLVASGLLLWGYGCHQRQVGILQGEINARGESIKQLSQLAAGYDEKYHLVWKDMKRAIINSPVNPGSAEAEVVRQCTILALTCDQRDSVKTKQIEELNKQNKALLKRGKPSVWSKLPWVLGGVVAGKLILK